MTIMSGVRPILCQAIRTVRSWERVNMHYGSTGTYTVRRLQIMTRSQPQLANYQTSIAKQSNLASSDQDHPSDFAHNDSLSSSEFNLSSPKFSVPPDAPPVKFLPRYTMQSIEPLLAMKALRAYAISNETLRLNIQVSMHDKTKKKGRPRDPIRGMAILPHAFKQPQKVIVFTRGKNITIAHEAGATAAGVTDLLAQVMDDEIEFDIALATPDIIPEIRSAGRKLRQRMPSVKNGTVVEDVREGVLRFSRGMMYKTDAHGNLNIPFGKVEQSLEDLQENFEYLIENVLQHNLGSRDKFIQKLYMSSDQTRSKDGAYKLKFGRLSTL